MDCETASIGGEFSCSLSMGGNVRDEFTVDENGLTSDGFHRIVAVSLKSMYVERIIEVSILAAMCSIAFFYSVSFDGYEVQIRVAIVLFLTVYTVYLLISPAVFYRRYRYRIDEENLEIRSGVVTIVHTMVPIERIHQVEVVRGPINRIFGLSSVVVTTAGGRVTIHYLDDQVADTIAGLLNDSIVKLLKTRDS